MSEGRTGQGGSDPVWSFTMLDLLSHPVRIELLRNGMARLMLQHGPMAIAADLNPAMVMSLALRLIETNERSKGRIPSPATAQMQAEIADLYELPDWLRRSWGLPARASELQLTEGLDGGEASPGS